MARDVLTRLTFEGRNRWSIWGHDGRRVIYASNRVGTSFDVYSKPADGTEGEQALLVRPGFQIAHAVSRDGQSFVVTESGPTSYEVAVLSAATGAVTPIVPRATSPTLSPDGRWVAYASTESGRSEIYVRPTSGEPGKWLISTDGGGEPLWGRHGAEIFYRNRDQMMAVPVELAAGFEHGTARPLFTGAYELDNQQAVANYDVTADGQRFLMLRDESEPAAGQLHVVLNWVEELIVKVPVR